MNTIMKDKSELATFKMLLENGLNPDCPYRGYHERVRRKGVEQGFLRKAMNQSKTGKSK